ncbi:hypothetical protein [Emticicia sp. W12TSBA100-4]|uniref:hypothetical protein n=1 Tax=Emticicia sp. W12TSBA100-4 TaxID=3160965 RepID=UPI0033065A1D
MEKKYQINVLWIEDNPCNDGLLAEALAERDSIDLGDVPPNIEVPAITFSPDSGRLEYFKYFNLQILQHPEEIKEYLSMSLEVEDKYGSKALGSIDGGIPDIVPFDYKLSPNITINRNDETENPGNIFYISEFRKLREYYNPNFKIIKSFFRDRTLTLENVENYYFEEFSQKINYDLQQRDQSVETLDRVNLKDDDMGLFAGVLVSRQFRNHVTVGIPVTNNKRRVDLLTAHGKYYEWLNSYDLGTMFRRTNKGSKKWIDILQEAVQQLRQRIKTQVESGKIQPNLTQLIDLKSGHFPIFGNDDKRIFTFTSIYGTRELPLDGLFIDVDVAERDEAIMRWASQLYTILLAGRTDAEITDAERIVSRFWTAYTSGLMRQRHIFSFLELQKEILASEGVKLDKDQDKIRQDLRDFYTISEKYRSERIHEEHTIELRKAEIESKSIFTKRLVIFFMGVRLWNQYYQASQAIHKPNIHHEFKEKSIETLVSEPPTERDLIALLYPVPAEPIILPIHKADESNNGDKIRTHLRQILGFEGKHGYDAKGDIITNLPNLITKQEVVFVKNYADKMGFDEFIEDENGIKIPNEYYPNWLKFF